MLKEHDSVAVQESQWKEQTMQSRLYLLESFKRISQCNRRVNKITRHTEIKTRDTGNRHHQFKHQVTGHKQRRRSKLSVVHLFINCTALKWCKHGYKIGKNNWRWKTWVYYEQDRDSLPLLNFSSFIQPYLNSLLNS